MARLRQALEIRKEAQKVADQADVMVNELVLLHAGTRFTLEMFQRQMPASGAAEGNFMHTKTMIRKAEFAQQDSQDRIRQAEQQIRSLLEAERDVQTATVSSDIRAADVVNPNLASPLRSMEQALPND
jgi:hypothetical protein